MCELRCWFPDDKSVFVISWNLLTLLKQRPPSLITGAAITRCGNRLVLVSPRGFAHLTLESWRLLMSFICSELMKGESVKAKVFVKAFLKPQETCWLCGRLPEEDAGKGKEISLPPACPAERSSSAIPEMSVGMQAWSREKSLVKVLRENRKKCFFTRPRTSGFGVCFVPVQSWVSVTRPESSTQAHWNGNGFAVECKLF